MRPTNGLSKGLGLSALAVSLIATRSSPRTDLKHSTIIKRRSITKIGLEIFENLQKLFDISNTTIEFGLTILELHRYLLMDIPVCKIVCLS